MSVSIEWYIEGEKQISRNLRGLNTSMRDFRIPIEKASKKLINIFSKDVFSTQGGVINERWERLSPYTVAQKARMGFPPDPLIRTGKMKNSFTSIVTSTMAVIKNDTTYFKYHQSNKPRKKIPRRVMMKLADNQKEMVIKEFQMYIMGLTKG